jgi:poly-gamma-glutamate synthesis protein (capsule biosynthesis protein)
MLRRAFLAAALAPERDVLIRCGGDVMLGRGIGRLAREKKDPAWPLRAIGPWFAAADIAFLNLESPFFDQGPPQEKGMVFKAEPEMIAALKIAGIDVVSTANNHSRDRGEAGLEFTRALLRKHHIAAAGTGPRRGAAHAGTILKRHRRQFAFLAYTYDQRNGNWPAEIEGVAMLDPALVARDVSGMKVLADVILVSMHAGVEYAEKPHRDQIAFARAAIDAGAAAVIGHHPHVAQPAERYKDGVIFYSLGNLVFDQFQRAETQAGLVAELRFSGSRLATASACRVELVQGAPQPPDSNPETPIFRENFPA